MSRTKTFAFGSDVPAGPGDEVVFVFQDVQLRVDFISDDPGYDKEQAR